jgi:hypothetical protein
MKPLLTLTFTMSATGYNSTTISTTKQDLLCFFMHYFSTSKNINSINIGITEHFVTMDKNRNISAENPRLRKAPNRYK